MHNNLSNATKLNLNRHIKGIHEITVISNCFQNIIYLFILSNMTIPFFSSIYYHVGFFQGRSASVLEIIHTLFTAILIQCHSKSGLLSLSYTMPRVDKNKMAAVTSAFYELLKADKD